MGLARRAQGAKRRRCRCTSLTTSNAAIAAQPPCALWVPAARAQMQGGAPRRCTETSPASRRLASAPAALGTRPLLIIGQAPSPEYANRHSTYCAELRVFKRKRDILASWGEQLRAGGCLWAKRVARRPMNFCARSRLRRRLPREGTSRFFSGMPLGSGSHFACWTKLGVGSWTQMTATVKFISRRFKSGQFGISGLDPLAK